MDVMKKIEEFKLVPVIVLENSEFAIPLGTALLEGGLPIAEVTFRTSAAPDSIKILKNEFPNLLIGAGTVLTVDQVKSAVEVGAQFIVTPGFNPTVVDYCINKNIVICPGLNSPSFIEWGLERGLSHFKFFPADLSGGTRAIKMLAGPYPMVKFMPTGGINNNNLIEYLKLENVFACGGSWIVKKDLINAKKFDDIKSLIKKALSLINSELS